METETHKLARIHYEVGYRITGNKKWYISKTEPKYEEYYNRILSVIHGEHICPVCDVKDEDGNPLILDDEAKKHVIDPEIYFGVLIILRKDLRGTATTITSETAINNFYKLYHKLLKTEGDVLGFIRNKYLLSQDAYILNALINGEKIISSIQVARNFTRWEALVFCIDFNMVTDLYVISCKEAATNWDSLVKLRPRLVEINNKIANEVDYKSTLLKRTIYKVRKSFYEQGIIEVSVKKGYKGKAKKGSYKSMQETEWREGWS